MPIATNQRRNVNTSSIFHTLKVNFRIKKIKKKKKTISFIKIFHKLSSIQLCGLHNIEAKSYEHANRSYTSSYRQKINFQLQKFFISFFMNQKHEKLMQSNNIDFSPTSATTKLFIFHLKHKMKCKWGWFESFVRSDGKIEIFCLILRFEKFN